MKRFISLFTMLMFLFAGTAMAQTQTQNHNVNVNIQPVSFLQLTPGDIFIDINAFDIMDETATLGSDQYAVTDPNQKVQFFDLSTTLSWGTNDPSGAQITVSSTGSSPGLGLDYNSYGQLGGIPDVQDLPYNLVNAGDRVPNGPMGLNGTTLVNNIVQGAGELDLRYRVKTDILEAPTNGWETTTVTYTLQAN